jgi:hypothetical protein
MMMNVIIFSQGKMIEISYCDVLMFIYRDVFMSLSFIDEFGC